MNDGTYAVLSNLTVVSTSFFSYFTSLSFVIRMENTSFSFPLISGKTFSVFPLDRTSLLYVTAGKEERCIEISNSQENYFINFKGFELSLSFKFTSNPWNLLDDNIHQVGSYKDESYYFDPNTLETSTQKKFFLDEYFPSFIKTVYNGQLIYIDRVNKIVLDAHPSAKLREVKYKIKNLTPWSSKMIMIYKKIVVDRSNLLESFRSAVLPFLMYESISDLRISFLNEIGEDQGAITKEFFYLLFKEIQKQPFIVNNDNILDISHDYDCPEFFYEYEKEAELDSLPRSNGWNFLVDRLNEDDFAETNQDYKKSMINILDDIYDDCRLNSRTMLLITGMVLGCCLVLHETIDANFSLLFYENLLNRNYNITHIQDTEVQRSLSYLSPAEQSEEIFNRYILPKINQYDYVRFGFKSIIFNTKDLTAFDFPFIFKHYEPLTVNRFKSFVSYYKCNEYFKEINWLWKYLEENQHFLPKLLLFVTGSGNLPSVDSDFKIVFELTSSTDQLFRASACTRRLYISRFTTYKKLQEKLEISLENAQGFHFV